MRPRKFEVWSEGYSASGESGGAIKMGEAVAQTFEEACAAVLLGDTNYDPKRGTYWGCRLYESERRARASYG